MRFSISSPMGKGPLGREEEGDEEETETETDEDESGEGVEEVRGKGEFGERGRRIMIRVVSGKRSGGGSMCCQADECSASLSLAKRYHRRHKVCERHAKAAVVLVAGLRQRFCQQCSRFHEVSQFDDNKRSCRNRLAGHNERRRKAHPELMQVEDGEGPSAESEMSSGNRNASCSGQMRPQRKPSNKYSRTT